MKRVVLGVCLLVLFMGGGKSVFAAPYNDEPTQKIVSVSMLSSDSIWYAGTGDYAHYFLVKHWDGSQFQFSPGFPRLYISKGN